MPIRKVGKATIIENPTAFEYALGNAWFRNTNEAVIPPRAIAGLRAKPGGVVTVQVEPPADPANRTTGSPKDS